MGSEQLPTKSLRWLVKIRLADFASIVPASDTSGHLLAIFEKY
jgi:hypothetical protein